MRFVVSSEVEMGLRMLGVPAASKSPSRFRNAVVRLMEHWEQDVSGMASGIWSGVSWGRWKGAGLLGQGRIVQFLIKQQGYAVLARMAPAVPDIV